jgi:hypothetical protein
MARWAEANAQRGWQAVAVEPLIARDWLTTTVARPARMAEKNS